MIRRRMWNHLLRGGAVALFMGLGGAAIQGQDVEMFGEHYGNVPPPGYYETLRLDPTAYSFKRGFRPPPRFDGGAGAFAPARVVGPRSGPGLAHSERFPGCFAYLLGVGVPGFRDEHDPVLLSL